MRDDEYVQHDATALAGLVKRGEVTATELLEVALGRLSRWNPALNAVVVLLEERARRAIAHGLPDGPFRGVPFLVKDWDGFLAGTEHTGSSRALRGVMPTRDSELMLRQQRAGLVIFGKTNLPELAILGTSESVLRGACRNPYNVAHSSGGSSGGSAAAVAARIVPMAHGGDGGGSIRIPASACGLVGMKPTRGRTPYGPDESEGWQGLSVRHAVTRTVRDCAALLDATRGDDVGAPYAAPAVERPYTEEVKRAPGKLRIAFSTASLLGRATHPDCVAAVNDAAQLLSKLGHDVVEASPKVDREGLSRAYLTMVASGSAVTLTQLGAMRGSPVDRSLLEPATQFLVALGHTLSAHDLEMARATFQTASREVAPFFQTYDLFLDATLAHPPAKIGQWDLPLPLRMAIPAFTRVATRRMMQRALDQFSQDGLERTGNTMLFNMTGQPAVSLPLYVGQDNLPIGVQFVARFGAEATLYRLAAQLEQERPWIHRAPPDPR